MSFLIKLQQNLSLFWQNVFFHIWTLQVTLRIEPSFKKEPLTAEKVKKQQFCSTLVTLCVFKLMFMFVQTLISIKLLQCHICGVFKIYRGVIQNIQPINFRLQLGSSSTLWNRRFEAKPLDLIKFEIHLTRLIPYCVSWIQCKIFEQIFERIL